MRACAAHLVGRFDVQLERLAVALDADEDAVVLIERKAHLRRRDPAEAAPLYHQLSGPRAHCNTASALRGHSLLRRRSRSRKCSASAAAIAL